MEGLWSKVKDGLWYSAMPRGPGFVAMVAVRGKKWEPWPNERYYYTVIGAEKGVEYATIGGSGSTYKNHASALNAAKNFASEMRRVSDPMLNPGKKRPDIFEEVIDQHRRIRITKEGPNVYLTEVFYDIDYLRPSYNNFGRQIFEDEQGKFGLPVGSWYMLFLGRRFSFDLALSDAKEYAKSLKSKEGLDERMWKGRISDRRIENAIKDQEEAERQGFSWLAKPSLNVAVRYVLFKRPEMLEVAEFTSKDAGPPYVVRAGKYRKSFTNVSVALQAALRWVTGGARHNPWEDDESNDAGEEWKAPGFRDAGGMRSHKKPKPYRDPGELTGIMRAEAAVLGHGPMEKMTVRHGELEGDIELMFRCRTCYALAYVRTRPIANYVSGEAVEKRCVKPDWKKRVKSLKDSELAKPPPSMRFVHDGNRVVLEHRDTGYTIGWLQTFGDRVRAYLDNGKGTVPKTYKIFDDEYRARAYLIRSIGESRRNPLFAQFLPMIGRAGRKAEVDRLRREKAVARGAREKARLQGEIERLTQQQRGMTVRRQQTVEFMCPECFATGTAEQGEPLSMQHKRPGCTGIPILSSIWRSKSEREKVALKKSLQARRQNPRPWRGNPSAGWTKQNGDDLYRQFGGEVEGYIHTDRHGIVVGSVGRGAKTIVSKRFDSVETAKRWLDPLGAEAAAKG